MRRYPRLKRSSIPFSGRIPDHAENMDSRTLNPGSSLAPERAKTLMAKVRDGAPGRIRTRDLRFTKPLLYQLSYKGPRPGYHICGVSKDKCGSPTRYLCPGTDSIERRSSTQGNADRHQIWRLGTSSRR